MPNPACKMQQKKSELVSFSGWISSLFSKIYNVLNFVFLRRPDNSASLLTDEKKHARDVTGYMLGEFQN
jgi:hypothetical protein